MNRYTRGFALPTVLLSSVILLALLTVSVHGVINIRQSLNDQYYTQLAKSAAESGVQQLENCINLSFQTDATIDTTRTYAPNTRCDGTTDTAQSIYLLSSAQVRTTYTAKIDSSTQYTYRVRVDAKTELLRAVGGAAWKTYTNTLSADASRGLYSASRSSIGYYEVCGVIDGKTWCWGKNEDGQLGDGTTTDSLVPVRVAREGGMLAGRVDSDVAVGRNFACTISSNEVYCWGSNERGQLGNGTTTASRKPVKVNSSGTLAGKSLTGIVASEKTACVIASGDAYCWGDSRYGQLGIGIGVSSVSNTSSAYYRTTPRKVSTIGASVSSSLTVTKISTTANARHVCAVVLAGDAYCWGGNDNGALGWKLNDYYDQYAPVKVDRTYGDLGGRTITDIGVGGWISEYGSRYGSHTCAVADGRIFCWGNNDDGQMGNNSWQANASEVGYTVPLAVTLNGIPTTGMEQVGVGYGHSCARRASEIWCWGQNNLGQLGLGSGYTDIRYTTPQKVPTTTNKLAGKTITDMRAGVFRVCVVADASSYCWGNNDVGQIGDGTNGNYRNTATEAFFLRSKVPSIKF